jgi:hypothetical protein
MYVSSDNVSQSIPSLLVQLLEGRSRYLVRTFFRTPEEYKAERTVKGKMFMQVGWEEDMS